MSIPRRVALGLAGALIAPTLAFAAAAPICKGRDLTNDPAIQPHYAAFSDDLVNDEGLLWKIEKDGVSPSYLYGTIHSTQPEVVAMAREAARYLEGAKSVVTELGGPFDAGQKVNMGAGLLSAALSTGTDTFDGELSRDDAALAERYLGEHGYPTEMAHHLKLWFLALATAMPSCETLGEQQGLPEVDDTLAALGKSKGLPVIALETMDEQIGTIAATPPKLAAEMLLTNVRAPELTDDAFVTMLALYREKHPALALPLLDAVPGLTDADRRAEQDFTKILLNGRNATMAERAAPRLVEGGAFIAVGAMHLPGKDGLIERFRAMGYRVAPIW